MANDAGAIGGTARTLHTAHQPPSRGLWLLHASRRAQPAEEHSQQESTASRRAQPAGEHSQQKSTASRRVREETNKKACQC